MRMARLQLPRIMGIMLAVLLICPSVSAYALGLYETPGILQEEPAQSSDATLVVEKRALKELRNKNSFYAELNEDDEMFVPLVLIDDECLSSITSSSQDKLIVQAHIIKISPEQKIDVCIDSNNENLVITELFFPNEEMIQVQLGNTIEIRFISLEEDEKIEASLYGLWLEKEKLGAVRDADEGGTDAPDIASDENSSQKNALADDGFEKPEVDSEAVAGFDLEAENPALLGMGESDKLMTGLTLTVSANEALPDYFSGSAWIEKNYNGGHWSPGGIYYSNPTNNVFDIYVETPYGSSYLYKMWCLVPGMLSPAEMGIRSGTAHFYFSHIDYSVNEYVYSVWIDFGRLVQDIGEGYFRVQGPTGALQIIKESGNNDITAGNDNYSLAGAVFRITNNTGSWAVDTAPTNEDGYANAVEGLWPGWYSVQEIVAPRGYRLDPTVYWVYVDAVPIVGITQHRFFDNPEGDPTPVRVQKLDTRTGEAYGIDDPTGQNLAGAQFTWHYYTGNYTTAAEAQASGSPTRTWTVETKMYGAALLTDSYLVSGSDSLFYAQDGQPMIPFGTVVIQETKPAIGYQLPDDPPLYLLQISMDAGGNVVRTLTKDGVLQTSIHELNQMIVEEEPTVVEVEKYDKDTNKPIPNTEFTLYQESAKGVGDWQPVTTKVTDEEGKLTFSPVALGSYKLSETRPNPLYASAEESGELDRFFVITPEPTGEVQVFYDEAIKISCEVYKDTINVTSAAFKTFDNDYLQVNNIGVEEYSYRVGFRSTSNVRADEFTVIDPLENAEAGQVRLTQLWTPVSFGDTDGFFNLWYQTNLTDPETVYSKSNAMNSNPYSVNNPQNVQVYPSVGWELWAEDLSATETTHLLVSDLPLVEGEYITGVRYEYGSVEVGFTTSNTSIPMQQTWKSSLDWTPTAPTAKQKGNFEEQKASAATGLYPAYYLVVCPEGIVPPTEIRSTANSQIARNVVLTDYAEDHVVTTTIEPFILAFDSTEPEGSEDAAVRRASGRFPQTGDANFLLLAGSLSIAVFAVFMLFLQMRRRAHRNSTNNLNR